MTIQVWKEIACDCGGEVAKYFNKNKGTDDHDNIYMFVCQKCGRTDYFHVFEKWVMDEKIKCSFCSKKNKHTVNFVFIGEAEINCTKCGETYVRAGFELAGTRKHLKTNDEKRDHLDKNATKRGQVRKNRIVLNFPTGKMENKGGDAPTWQNTRK